MSIKNTTNSDRLPLHQSFKKVLIPLSIAAAAIISGCGHNDVPSSVHARSGVTEKPPELGYDHIEYKNTSSFDIPRNNLYARLPSVQAYLSESGGSNYVGSKSAYNPQFPRYILIDSGNVDKWRYAQVDSPRANRSYYAAPMRLPISQEVPVGKYIAVRPVTKLWPADRTRDDKQPDAYLFSVLASADAKENAGNLLTISSAVDAIQNGDWIVPISYLNLSQDSVSSVMEENPPTILTFAEPANLIGASGHIAIVRGGLNQGLSYGDNATIMPGRLRDMHARANRDGRDIRPEGIATARVIQAIGDYSLVEILDSAQQVVEGDMLIFRHSGKSK